MLQQGKIKIESMEKLNFIKATKFTKYNLKEISKSKKFKRKLKVTKKKIVSAMLNEQLTPTYSSYTPTKLKHPE